MMKLLGSIIATVAIVMLALVFPVLIGESMTARNIRLAVREAGEASWNSSVGRVSKGFDYYRNQAIQKTYNAVQHAAAQKEDLERAALDASITAAVKMKLLNDESPTLSQIYVETRGGVVILRGSVSSRGEFNRAISAAEEVEGVGSVLPRLHVLDE